MSWQILSGRGKGWFRSERNANDLFDHKSKRFIQSLLIDLFRRSIHIPTRFSFGNRTDNNSYLTQTGDKLLYEPTITHLTQSYACHRASMVKGYEHTYWFLIHISEFSVCINIAGIILGVGSANERWRYILTSSLIGCVHTRNDPCLIIPDTLVPMRNLDRLMGTSS